METERFVTPTGRFDRVRQGGCVAKAGYYLTLVVISLWGGSLGAEPTPPLSELDALVFDEILTLEANDDLSTLRLGAEISQPVCSGRWLAASVLRARDTLPSCPYDERCYSYRHLELGVVGVDISTGQRAVIVPRFADGVRYADIRHTLILGITPCEKESFLISAQYELPVADDTSQEKPKYPVILATVWQWWPGTNILKHVGYSAVESSLLHRSLDTALVGSGYYRKQASSPIEAYQQRFQASIELVASEKNRTITLATHNLPPSFFSFTGDQTDSSSPGKENRDLFSTVRYCPGGAPGTVISILCYPSYKRQNSYALHKIELGKRSGIQWEVSQRALARLLRSSDVGEMCFLPGVRDTSTAVPIFLSFLKGKNENAAIVQVDPASGRLIGSITLPMRQARRRGTDRDYFVGKCSVEYNMHADTTGRHLVYQLGQGWEGDVFQGSSRLVWLDLATKREHYFAEEAKSLNLAGFDGNGHLLLYDRKGDVYRHLFRDDRLVLIARMLKKQDEKKGDRSL